MAKKIYVVISDLNAGANPIGSEIELEEAEAAKIPHAVKLKSELTKEEKEELKALAGEEEEESKKKGKK